MHDFQFFNKERIEAITAKENELATQKRTQMNLIKELRQREKRSGEEGDGEEAKEEADRLEAGLEEFVLSPEETAEKEELIEAGFGDWHRRDLKCFLAACERFGRAAKAHIFKTVAEETGKEEQQVRGYSKVFWERYKEINDWEKMIEKIEKGEKRIERNQEIETALRLKVARHKNPWQTLKINYGTNKGKAFTEEEDIFLVCKMNELGYGNWEELKIAIRQAWQFRFDWFIKSRTPLELQRRCETLTRLIEKENEELENERKAEEKAQKAKKKGKGSADGKGKKRGAPGSAEGKKKKGKK